MGVLVNDKTPFATYNVATLPSTFDYDLKLKQCVEQAKLYYIQKALGAKLYNTLVAYNGSPDDSKLNDLIDGCTYDLGSTVTYINPGLNRTICFFAWSLFCKEAQIEVTKFGLVSKLNPDTSAKITATEQAFLVQKNMEFANESLQDVLTFLCRKSTDYPDYYLRDSNAVRSKVRIIGD